MKHNDCPTFKCLIGYWDAEVPSAILSFNVVYMDSVVLLKNKQTSRREMTIKQQKSRETRKQLKSCETREVAYTCRYTSGNVLPIQSRL